ncbi:GNAT family N-acetyltransferase [Nocardia sp. NPDC005366]|uniref:GNAT family N-acetyltransferase n=1 Tax=Nocardia sp. NPDC005366 TaxID=3156878 RepID=UPI0033BC6C55
MSRWRIESLTAEHTHGLAECHIACWREAYDGLVPRHLLDAFDVDRRAAQWERTRVKYPRSTHIALSDGIVIGFASAGSPKDEPPAADLELNALYIRAPWYGTGVADDLIDVALTPGVSCSLWVFAENPRAQAFYRKHGFALDGAHKIEDFTPALMVRMVRAAREGDQR